MTFVNGGITGELRDKLVAAGIDVERTCSVLTQNLLERATVRQVAPDSPLLGPPRSHDRLVVDSITFGAWRIELMGSIIDMFGAAAALTAILSATEKWGAASGYLWMLNAIGVLCKNTHPLNETEATICWVLVHADNTLDLNELEKNVAALMVGMTDEPGIEIDLKSGLLRLETLGVVERDDLMIRLVERTVGIPL